MTPTDTPAAPSAAPFAPPEPPPRAWNPSPGLLARLADGEWIHTEFNAGRLDEYRGRYVAVVDRKVLGAGADLLVLRDTVAREHGVPPGRIVTDYVDEWNG